MKARLVKESLLEFDTSVIEEFNDFAEEVYRILLEKGIPKEKVEEMKEDDSLQDDMWYYYEDFNYNEEPIRPEQYVNMILNKWSGMPKYDDRIEEGILSKRRTKRITDGAPVNKLVDVLDMIEDEEGLDRIDAIYILEKNMKYIKELINSRYNTYEIYHKLKEENLI